MSEITSTPNGGSKRDRANYKEAKTKEVSWEELMKDIKFDLNFIAVEFKDNTKIIGGDEETVEVSSYASKAFDLQEIEEMGVKLSNVRDVTPENAEKIKRRRAKEKAKKAEEEKENNENKKSNIDISKGGKQVPRENIINDDKDAI